MPEFTQLNPELPPRDAGSSAGTPTQRFAPASQERPLVVNQRNTAAALLLLTVGLLMLLGRMSSSLVGWGAPPIPPIPPMPPTPYGLETVPGMVLFTIASCLLFFAFWRRFYPLLIPGCLLAGLAFGVMFINIFGPAAVLWGLALGFLAIMGLGRRLFNIDRSWPIYPAVPLFGIGVIAAMLEPQRSFLVANTLLWLPVLLIGAGLYLGWGRKTAL